MSCCGGSGQSKSCTCKLRAGANIEIEGNGSSTKPYVITGKSADVPDPTPRGSIRYLEESINERVGPIEVRPAITGITVVSLTIDNPDPERAAVAIITHELDLRFRLPAVDGDDQFSGANTVLDGDEMSTMLNTGNVDLKNAHQQVVKTGTLTIPPGGSVDDLMVIAASGGAGGAVCWAVQAWIKAWVVTL